MKKNRTIPFGYVMLKGEIMPDPVEGQAVREIFIAYLKGSSLSEIARYMSIRQISYNGVSTEWNKNMVKRILENEKYLGKGEYIALIEEDVFISANNKKKTKATTLNEIPKVQTAESRDKYHQLRVAAYCRVSTEQEEQL